LADSEPESDLGTDSVRRRFGKTENEGLKPVSAEKTENFSVTEKLSAFQQIQKPKNYQQNRKPKNFRQTISVFQFRFGSRSSK